MGRASAIVVRAAGHTFSNSETGTRIAPEVGFTTNNRMELASAIGALRHLRSSPAPANIINDSDYVKNGITSCIASWQRKGCKTATGQPFKNHDTLQELPRRTPLPPWAFHWHPRHADLTEVVVRADHPL